jgi:secondary thiamine-phosphate synthase enzyme
MITKELQLKTTTRIELVDITSQVERAVEATGVTEGICILTVPHTTAAITVNENADPSVKADIITKLNTLAPAGDRYQHSEGNADAHIKATVVGPSETLLVEGGRLLLGTWQGVFFCEFDGPRSRRVVIKVF